MEPGHGAKDPQAVGVRGAAMSKITVVYPPFPSVKAAARVEAAAKAEAAAKVEAAKVEAAKEPERAGVAAGTAGDLNPTTNNRNIRR
jgi:hypothetical protein